MNEETLPIFPDYVTLSLLLVSLFIFTWLAARSKGVNTFQFQVSVFIGLMVVGAIVELAAENGLLKLPQFMQDLGFLIHVSSMVFFSLMIWLRYYFSKKAGRTMIEEIEK